MKKVFIKSFSFIVGATVLISVSTGALAQTKPNQISLHAPASITDHRVVVYSMPGCLGCYEAKSLLNKAHIPFEDINMANKPELWEELAEQTGGWDTVPMVFIDDKFIGGSEELKKLYEDGELSYLVNE